MPYLDFAAIKRQLPIVEVARHLGITVRPEAGKETFRGKCPICEDLRSFTITPHGGREGLDICGCFKCPASWDAISLVKVVKGFDRMPEAAQYLIDQFGGAENRTVGNSTVSKPRAKRPPEANQGQETPVKAPEARQDAPQSPLKPLEHLATNHPVIELLGLTSPTCEAIGIGYTGKGMMRGRVAIPLRLPDGSLVGYLGIATTTEQEPLLLFPKNLEEKATAPAPAAAAPPPSEPKKPADELRKLFRVVA